MAARGRSLAWGGGVTARGGVWLGVGWLAARGEEFWRNSCLFADRSVSLVEIYM